MRTYKVVFVLTDLERQTEDKRQGTHDPELIEYTNANIFLILNEYMSLLMSHVVFLQIIASNTY